MTAAGWYRSPSGTLLRWWTGWMWGPDVAGPDDRPLPPPVQRRYLPVVATPTVVEALLTRVLDLPATGELPPP